jgi:hypothetical protein
MKLQPKPTRCPWPNVQSFEQDGKWRHYYRKRHAPRIALPAGDWRTREFKEAYEAAKTRAVMGLATLPATNLKAQLATLPPDSFEALARALLKSKRFAQLAPKTRKEGTRIINTICGLPASTDPNHPAHKFPFGEYTARDLKPKHFLTLRDRKEDTPQEADDWLNWCQKIYAHAIPRELGGVETNPVRDVERFKQQSKQIEPWSRQDDGHGDPLPVAPADLTVWPTDSLIGLDRIRDGSKLALLIGWWGAPATYSGTGARSSAAASVAIAVIWRADLTSAYWRAILRPALTCSTCCLAASSSRTVFSVGVIGSGLMAAVVASGHDGRIRWRFSVGAMATDLSSSSTVRSPGDADGFLRRTIQFPLQLRNGWLPKQFHYSFALILLSVSRLPGANPLLDQPVTTTFCTSLCVDRSRSCQNAHAGSGHHHRLVVGDTDLSVFRPRRVCFVLMASGRSGDRTDPRRVGADTVRTVKECHERP